MSSASENSFDDSFEDSIDDSVSSKNNIVQTKRKSEDVTTFSKKIKTEVQKQESKDRKNLYKAPTAEELNNLRETENLYNSNLFRFQIDGLLDEIKVKPKYINLFNKWFNQFEQFMLTIPEYGTLKLSEFNYQDNTNCETQKFINLFKYHKSAFETDRDVSIKFLKPDGFRVFKLHENNLTIGPKLKVKSNIVMPKACFSERDYLNNRYIIKRDYYAAYMFIQLTKSKLFSRLIYINDTSTIEAELHVCSKIHIQFYITPSTDSFKLRRFGPFMNNVRVNIFEHFEGINLDDLKQHGTPLYNSFILRDLTLRSNYDYLEECLKDVTSIQDGIRLMHVWLIQRNLCVCNGFSYELLLNLVVYMMKKRKINKLMSSYQIIRNIWVFLSSSNWHESPISLCNKSAEYLQKFNQQFDVVFVDSTGYYNIASFVNLEVYLKIRSEAKLAVQFLDEVKFDTFQALFLTKMEPELQYDALLRLTDTSCYRKVYKSILPIETFKYFGFYVPLITRKIINVLKERLNKRICNIVPLCPTDDLHTKTVDLTFGLILNRECAFSIIEKGPPSNTEAAVEFRRFWGTLSECRRFADGTICEALYFKSNTAQEKRQIFKQMISLIVRDKLEIEDHTIFCDQFEEMLALKNVIAPFPIGTNEEASLKVIKIFDELDAKIREFKLPLEIADLRGISEVFCFTNVFPPIPTNYKWGKAITSKKEDSIVLKEDCNIGIIPRYVEPIECVIQLGINSKWPKDIERLRDVKTIYYIEISKLFKQSNILTRASPDYLEVLFKGLVFRFRLYHSKEVALLKKYIKADGTTAYKDNEESILLERNLRILPKIIGSLRGLQAQNNCYGVSTVLIKRWLRTQLLDEFHIPDIVISLLNAHVFLRSAPFDWPNLPQVAFLRFVKFFAEFDCNTQLVLINFNNEMSKEDIDNIQLNFEQNRQAYPLLHIVTAFDEGRSWFTKQCYKEILNHLKRLTCETLAIVQNNIVKDMDFTTIQKLFVPNMEGYNVLIHLKPHLNPLRFQQLDFTNKFTDKLHIQEFTENETSAIPVTGFNLALKYLNDLRESYGNLALFFYDSFGGNTIGVLWKPSATEKKSFKVSHIESGLELNDNELILNKAVILEDFYILGCGLVKNVIEM